MPRRAEAHRGVLAVDAIGSNPTRGERDHDDGQHDRCLGDVAGGRHSDGGETGHDRDQHGELDGCVPRVSAKFHALYLPPSRLL